MLFALDGQNQNEEGERKKISKMSHHGSLNSCHVMHIYIYSILENEEEKSVMLIRSFLSNGRKHCSFSLFLCN